MSTKSLLSLALMSMGVLLAGAQIAGCGSDSPGGTGGGGKGTGGAGESTGGAGTGGAATGTGGAATSTGGAGTGGAATSTGGAGTGGAATNTGGAGTGGAAAGTGGAPGGASGSAGGRGGSASGGAGGRGNGGAAGGAAGAAVGALATIAPLTGGTITGTADFVTVATGVQVTINLANCPAGVHGIHIHQGTGCAMADQGNHWGGTGTATNPTRGEGIGMNMGEITCDAQMKGGPLVYTRANTPANTAWSIGGSATTNIIGHPVVVHSAAVATDRHGCGVIQMR